jgi:oligopeptide transport system substrate-binding protein
MKSLRKLTRREFFKLGGIAAVGAALAGITPKVAGQAVQVDNKVYLPIVDKDGKTLVTPQGKTLPRDAAPLAQQIFKTTGKEPLHFDHVGNIYNGGGALMLTESLTRIDATMAIVPALAETWSVGANCEYWEITLREFAKWSDGTLITADDVVYSFVHMADPQVNNPFAWFFIDIKGFWDYFTGVTGPEAISDPTTGGVRKVNERTVRIYGNNKPIPHLMALLSHEAAGIVPKHVVEVDPLHWADLGVGVVSGGPYQVKNWVHNSLIEYEPNLAYNGPHRPGIQHFFEIIPPAGVDPFTQWVSHNLTLLPHLSNDNTEAVRANPSLLPLLHSYNNFQTEYLSLDTLHAPLNNLMLRQALSHAIDRETLCSTVLNQTYLPAYSMLAPNFPAYNPNLAVVQDYDVTAAQSLLASAGFPGGIDPGTGQPLALTLYDNSDSNDHPLFAFIQQQLQTHLNITVNIIEVPNGEWAEKRSHHQMQMYKGPYEYDFVDARNLLPQLWHSHPSNYGDPEPWGSDRHPWKNLSFDLLCDLAEIQTDFPTRIQNYKDAEQILVSDVGGIFLIHQRYYQIWWPELVGMQAGSDGNVVYRAIDISRFQMYIKKT